MEDLNNDPLYNIFIRHLNSPIENESEEEFTHSVVSEYIYVLFQTGNVPERFTDHLEVDLKEEVTIMLKKKIYGFFSLNQFRESERAKNTKKAS